MNGVVIFGGPPVSGQPPLLANWSEFEDYMDTLLRAGKIRGTKQVRPDIRPHPDFAARGIRMPGGVPDARVITEDSGSTARMRGELREPASELVPAAIRPGCQAEPDTGSEIAENGASHERQRAIVEKGGDHADVFDACAAEFANDRFAAPGELADART